MIMFGILASGLLLWIAFFPGEFGAWIAQVVDAYRIKLAKLEWKRKNP